jgi:hypothetical protein
MSDNITSATEEFDQLLKPQATQEEKVWCKIGPRGDLETFDWDYAEAQAREYDALDPLATKNNSQIICKLAMLIRAQTIQKCQEVLGKFSEHSQTASAVIIKNPLED